MVRVQSSKGHQKKKKKLGIGSRFATSLASPLSAEFGSAPLQINEKRANSSKNRSRTEIWTKRYGSENRGRLISWRFQNLSALCIAAPLRLIAVKVFQVRKSRKTREHENMTMEKRITAYQSVTLVSDVSRWRQMSCDWSLILVLVSEVWKWWKPR